jgi:hypothetical protein
MTLPRDGTAMLTALLALMAPLWDRTATHGEATDGGATDGEATDVSAARLLLVTATALAAILAIVLADLHSTELRALGLAGEAAPVSAIFLSP